MEKLSSQREKFNLQRKVAYLNCAYMGPLPKKTEKAGIKGLVKKRKPYKISKDDFFRDTETLRVLFSDLISARDSNRSVVIPSVSYGMANVAVNLPRKGKIIVVEGQFPSNVYPWQYLVNEGYSIQIVQAPETVEKGKKWNARILEAIDKETVLLAIGHVHWADGTLFDLESMSKRLREVDGLLAIDGTQSIGALPFDVERIQPDALVCAGYKWLLGPYSIGMAWYGPRFDLGNPIEHNWINRMNSDDFAGLVDYEENFRNGALRYEVGEHSNFILVPMLLESLKLIRKWEVERVQEYCKALIDPFLPEIQNLGYGLETDEYRSNHLFGLSLPDNIEASLISEVMKRNKVSVSLRGRAIRVSPNVYNDSQDVKKLLIALEELISR